MGVINLASGDFMMLGAYAVVVTTTLGLPFVVGVLVATIVGLPLGALADVALVRRFARMPELAILGTFGLGIVIRQIVELIFGKSFQAVANPLPGALTVAGAEFPAYRLVLVGVAVVVLGGTLVVLSATSVGVKVRAVAADSALAETLGVRSTRLKMAVFAGSTALASLAGSLIAPLTSVGPNMGDAYLFVMFVVVIVGGARIGMVLVAAIVTAAVQNVTTIAIDSLTSKLALLTLAFALLALRRSRQGAVV